MQSRNTCNVCKKIHTGPNCWNTESDEEIDSGLLRAMERLLPKPTLEILQEIQQVPSRPSRALSIASTDSWEKEETSPSPEHVPIPEVLASSRQQYATTLVPNQVMEDNHPAGNTVISNVKTYLHQTLNTDIERATRRHDSGLHNRQRSDGSEILHPQETVRFRDRYDVRVRESRVPKDSFKPAPLKFSERKLKQQPDGQPRKSEEYELGLQAATEHGDLQDYLQRGEEGYRSQTASERDDMTRYQRRGQEYEDMLYAAHQQGDAQRHQRTNGDDDYASRATHERSDMQGYEGRSRREEGYSTRQDHDKQLQQGSIKLPTHEKVQTSVGEEERYTSQHPLHYHQQQQIKTPSPKTLALDALKKYYHHDRQKEETTIPPHPKNSPTQNNDPPGDLTHPSYRFVLDRPMLPITHFLPKGAVPNNFEGAKRQTFWECALNRLEGRIGDEEIWDEEWKGRFLKENPVLLQFVYQR